MRAAAIVVAILVVLVVGAQLLATPFARWYTRRELGQLEGYRATVHDVTASVIPLRYRMQGLSIVETPVEVGHEPLLYVRHLEARVEWRRLLQGDLVANLALQRPKVDLRTEHKKRGPAALPSLGEKLEEMAPLRVDVLRIRDGEADLVDATQSPAPKIWVHGVNAEIRNLATREALSRGRPTTLEATGTLQSSGALSAHLEADPWEKALTFRGRVELRHLAATDIDALLVATTDLKPTKGSIDLFAELAAKDGQLDGGVKVMAHNLEVAPGRRDLWTKMKSWLAGAALDVFGKKESPRVEEVATVVPIKGELTDPDAQLWPTILGVVRNAFVQGLDEGFQNVPPQTAEKPQGPLDQAAEALKKKAGPPKAQPQARTPRR